MSRPPSDTLEPKQQDDSTYYHVAGRQDFGHGSHGVWDELVDHFPGTTSVIQLACFY